VQHPYALLSSASETDGSPVSLLIAVKWPGLHATQVLAFVAATTVLYMPAAQSMHALVDNATCELYVPAGQSVQKVAPALGV